jgi:hypothetical protein
LKTIYETHIWEGKFEVKRKIVWVLGVVWVLDFHAFWRCLVLGVLEVLSVSVFRRCLGYRRFGVLCVVWVLGFQAFWGCLVLGVLSISVFRSRVVWIIGVLGVLCISIINLVKPKFSEKEKEQGKERAAEEERGEILRKGNGTRKGKERGAEEERGEAGKKKKILKNKWREEIWSQIWRWILT